MTRRLAAIDDVAPGVRRPGYDPADHGIGIVHLGFGAFHRAHQAVYTDDALAAEGGDWRIVGVSLRSAGAAGAVNPQNGLYTVVERGAASTARLIASVSHVVAASGDREAALDAMADPAVRIVSLTVTEKAYGIDRAAAAVDTAHPAVAADLENPRAPTGALGYLVEALRRRRERGIPSFTVLCCDNLPDNGALLRAGTVDFARRLDAELGDWVDANVAFPSTMVDRITPAATPDSLAEAAELIGCEDRAAVTVEPFIQWVIEDRFPTGRPAWEAGGALLVADVAPYERMKLRMLNGAHSMMAYAGYLAGHAYVRDVMADPALAALVARHLTAAAATLAPVKELDFGAYARELQDRFRNPAIAHETYQIAMDGSEKLPQRLLGPATDALAAGHDVGPFAFAAAAWMRYCLGVDDSGRAYALRDPREDGIAALTAAAGTDAAALAGALMGLADVFPDALADNGTWRDAVTGRLAAMLDGGMAEAIRREAANG